MNHLNWRLVVIYKNLSKATKHSHVACSHVFCSGPKTNLGVQSVHVPIMLTMFGDRSHHLEKITSPLWTVPYDFSCYLEWLGNRQFGFWSICRKPLLAISSVLAPFSAWVRRNPDKSDSIFQSVWCRYFMDFLNSLDARNDRFVVRRNKDITLAFPWEMPRENLANILA